MFQRLFEGLLLSFLVVHQAELSSAQPISSSSDYHGLSLRSNKSSQDILIKDLPAYCNPEPPHPIPSSGAIQSDARFQQPDWEFRNGEEDVIQDLRATEEDKKLILDLHNHLRRKVASHREQRGSPGPQPPAISMPNLKWDDSLANAAWEWAQNLQYKHEPDPVNYGQNLHMSFSRQPRNTTDWASVINGKDGWFDEVNYMDCASVVSFKSCQASNGKVIGHYTQLVWAETTHVGCAAIGYYDDYNGYPFTPGQPYKQFYICNYSPRGNAPNKPVYKVDYSSSSSNCPNQQE
ncbi:hypothetical protein GHT06_010193 [Daphnia sinensis]|uniref:SCP domain-containing protein n=1 Tax=Daphnia sinensis TaxID=1820382 RepID=A0AAD5Q042_9CRUS|nr:hypothetical protein GHT06_010193 [Daphnia sinensis]